MNGPSAADSPPLDGGTSEQHDMLESTYDFSADQAWTLRISVLIVALCGIVYELIIATISSYLLGNSVFQFSQTIGLFMFAMGMGSLFSGRLHRHLLEWFVGTEVLIALVGGLSSILLFTVFPWTSLYRPVMYTLILLVGGLVGLEIPLLMRVFSDAGGVRKSVASVLALDYFGALVGSVGFPLFLLPFLGLFRASFCVGLLNGLVALVNVWVFWNRLRHPRRWLFATLLILVVLLGCVVSASRFMRFAEGQLYADQIIYSEQTPYQQIVLTRNETTSEHRLYLDGHLQFAESDEYRYHEALVHPVMSQPGPRARVLVLGGGDGMALREVLKYDEVERVDLVDIDPAMVALCGQFPALRRLNQGALESARLTVHHEDAFRFLRERGKQGEIAAEQGGEPRRRFDRVLIDLPDPHNEALSKLYSVEFYRLVERCLSDRGVMVTQSASPWVTREAYWSIAKTLEAAGLRVRSYHLTVPNFGIWGFHLAGRQMPVEDFELRVATRFLSPAVFRAGLVFGKDARRDDAEVNSLFEPRLYLLYHRGLRQH